MKNSPIDPESTSRAPEYVYRIAAVAVALILLLTWFKA
jgi:hypothetical protein